MKGRGSVLISGRQRRQGSNTGVDETN